jgi:hypothetical protein
LTEWVGVPEKSIGHLDERQVGSYQIRVGSAQLGGVETSPMSFESALAAGVRSKPWNTAASDEPEFKSAPYASAP